MRKAGRQESGDFNREIHETREGTGNYWGVGNFEDEDEDEEENEKILAEMSEIDIEQHKGRKG